MLSPPPWLTLKAGEAESSPPPFMKQEARAQRDRGPKFSNHKSHGLPAPQGFSEEPPDAAALQPHGKRARVASPPWQGALLLQVVMLTGSRVPEMNSGITDPALEKVQRERTPPEVCCQ